MSRRAITHRVVAAFVAAFAANTGLTQSADPAHDPAAELASFKVPEGFEVKLFASEKDGIVKPIQIRWDDRGRLWVIGSQTYPQVKPGEEPNDKVWILRDTDGDGVSDQTTVFADGLLIPTGIEIAHVLPFDKAYHPPKGSSSVYVGEGTKLWLMSDTDGDNKVDRREVVLRGFGTGDNHQNLNSFRWSPSGELVFCQGLHAFSRVETVHGIVKLHEAGLWRFRPRDWRLDAFFGGAADPQNPWGWLWTRTGQPLVVAGNNGTMFYPLPEMIRGYQNGRRDTIWPNGRGRKTSGPEIIETAQFPPEWQGAMVAGGYINNAVWTFKIEDDGAGLRVVDHPTLPPLIQSNHGSFRPVDVRLGPDGALYVCDWYNPIIGHYQASFRHPDRDKQHGRIWRISWKGATAPSKVLPRSFDNYAAMLEAAATTSERFEREKLRARLWAEPGKAIAQAVSEWISRRDTSRADHDLAVLEAILMLQAHDTPDAAVLALAIAANAPDVRATAAESIARWSDTHPDFPDDLLGVLAADEHPHVRLAAIVAAGNIPRAQSATYIVQATGKGRDKFIDTAAKAAIAALRGTWEATLPEVSAAWTPPQRQLFAELAGVRSFDQVLAKSRTQPPAKKVATSPATPPAVELALPVVATGKLRAAPDFVTKLVADVRTKGDARRGAEIYRRAELACITCHRIGDQGGVIGPALDAIGSAQPIDFIIGAVLEPQREIKEGFETVGVRLTDGRILLGTIVAGTRERFTLRGSDGTETAVDGANVAERKVLGSLMPAGLVDSLAPEDLRDLVAYLAELGKAK